MRSKGAVLRITRRTRAPYLAQDPYHDISCVVPWLRLEGELQTTEVTHTLGDPLAWQYLSLPLGD